MNAEETEIARRLVACPKWVWLPGMMAPRRGRVCGVDGETLFFAGSDGRFVGDWEDHQCFPDLSDDLTRLGVLAVVRRAWGQDDLAAHRDDGNTWSVIPDGTDWWSGCCDSEIEALTRALEAAP